MSKHPYFLVPEENILKPWIGIQLGYKKTHKVTLKVPAIVDSGSDVCFCAEDIGMWLGVVFGKQKSKVFTAANSTTFVAWCVEMTLYFNGGQYQCPFYFAKTLPKETPIVLGQIGFFDRFKVTFDYRNREIEVV